MLRSLHIENIAVIERADIEFSPGFNVLTGETGAGKSIVIDSLQTVLGGRTGRGLVRSGESSALVSAVFDSAGTEEWCSENDIDCEDAELILLRKIGDDGKSSCRVNGVPVSVAQLRSLGDRLLDIHGQNDGRSLLDEKSHLSYLDRFSGDTAALRNFTETYNEWRSLRKRCEELAMDESEKERREENLKLRIAELEKAQIRPGEEEEITARRDLMRNSEKLTELLNEAYGALYGTDEAAVFQCSAAEAAARKASGWCAELKPVAQQIHEATALLQDASELLREQLDNLEFSPEEYDRLEERIAFLRRLERRYNTDEAGLDALLQESCRQLDELTYSGELLEKTRAQLSEAQKRARRAAEQLTAAREKAGKLLEKQVTKELAELSMPSVRFSVVLEPLAGEPGFTSSGAETVRFTMSANAGEQPGPISKIASGGELSRVMLALKSVFSSSDTVQTQVFDEIDTGVSGVAAQRVGEKMARLSKGRQILCVTHLPQIAALADTQLLVEKREKQGRTFTAVAELDRQGRILELARLYGGENTTAATLTSAAEQLDAAEQYKFTLLGDCKSRRF